jgi:hypothetical protein
MNIATNKLTANEVIREINLLQYNDWTAEQRQERIEVMQKALNIINTVLEDISQTDFNSRLYFSSQKGQVEHYLQICIEQVPQENMEKPLISDDCEQFIEQTEIQWHEETSKSNSVVIGMIVFWVLFILAAFLS